MTNCLESFIIGHWSVSHTVSERHFSAGDCRNVVECDNKRAGYKWLIEHLSQEGDCVLDVNSNGEVFVEAIKNGRNAVLLSTANDKSTFQRKISQFLASSDEEPIVNFQEENGDEKLLEGTGDE